MGMIADSMVNEWFSTLPKTDRIYRLIEKSMDDRSSKERMEAVMALGDSGDPRAVQSLIGCCRDQDPEIRHRAIGGLQNLRSGRAVEVLLDRLNDQWECPENRQCATRALAAIRSYGAIAGLRERYTDEDEDPAIRSIIAEELGWG